MFEGFTTSRIATAGAEIHVRLGGVGPPLILLHGYPQTGAMWHAVAPGLAQRFALVVPDLRGYGASSKPPSDPEHANYSKRAMATDMVEVMRQLGHESFFLAGHDRGGRAAYRLALDHPAAVRKLATLDIVPTHAQWRAMDWRGAFAAYHWLFLAQPAPLPERLIAADPAYYLEETLGRWGAPGFAYAAEAHAEYHQAWSNPEVVRAACEDYRAGATIDYAIDEADYGKRKITCPMLALWGNRPGAPPRDLVPTWAEWADDVRGMGFPCGHFLPEEAPGQTLAAMLEFFGE